MRYCCILPPFGCRECQDAKGNRIFESDVLWLNRNKACFFCNVCYEKKKKKKDVRNW